MLIYATVSSLVVAITMEAAPSREWEDPSAFYKYAPGTRPWWAGRASAVGTTDDRIKADVGGERPIQGGGTNSSGPTASVTGPSVDVWGAVNTLHRCGSMIASVPDIPARAYNDNDGLTHMIVGSTASVATQTQVLMPDHQPLPHISNTNAVGVCLCRVLNFGRILVVPTLVMP
jgi:hypothetical protein